MVGGSLPPTTFAGATTTPKQAATVVSVVGTVPLEVWNRLGTKLLPKLRVGRELRLGLDLSVTVDSNASTGLTDELREVIQDLGVAKTLNIEERPSAEPPES
jgi:hypothetical protein